MNIFKSIQLGTPAQSCQSCVHFKNDPVLIENVYPGLTTMSSGFASVRAGDGLCSHHQLYLSARDSCPDISIPARELKEFKPDTSMAEETKKQTALGDVAARQLAIATRT